MLTIDIGGDRAMEQVVNLITSMLKELSNFGAPVISLVIVKSEELYKKALEQVDEKTGIVSEALAWWH